MKTVPSDMTEVRHGRTAAGLPDAPHQRVSPIPSQQLFAGRQEITIAHGDGLYQLRQTRSGKLILTK
jgi:hemin uptake protein HemP